MADSTTNKGELTVYELGFLILPSIPEDKLSETVSLIKKIIAKHDGSEIDGEEPIKQDLAYSMSKTVGASRYVLSEAYFGWIKFEALPAKVLLIKSDVEKMNEVLRFLLVKTPRETSFTFAKAAQARKALEEEKEDSNAPSSTEEAVVK